MLPVNVRHVKNVSGRKSDVLDCQWLQQLMRFGLLHGAFRPAEQVCVLRSLSRQRAMLLRSLGRFVPHIQKALTPINIQLVNVISDVAGETGQTILRAIVAGERDGLALAQLRNARIRASEDEIAQSLQGSWRAEHLVALKQALDAFDFGGTHLSRPLYRSDGAPATCIKPIKGSSHCEVTQPGHRDDPHDRDDLFGQPHDRLAPIVKWVQCLISRAFFSHASHQEKRRKWKLYRALPTS